LRIPLGSKTRGLEVRGACSSNKVEVSQHTSRKIKIFVVRPEADLQYRFLLDGPLHPHGLTRRPRCWWRGFTSLWRGPRHGDGDGRSGRWACSFFFGLGPGGRSGRITGGHYKHDIISMHGNAIRQQQVPGRFDFLRFWLPHYPTTLWHQRQSVGQLHAWLGGVVPTCFSFSSLPHLGAHIFCGPAAALSCSKASPLCLNSGAGEEVVQSGDVESRRIAAVQLRVSLQEVLQSVME
jgi:hypothetical protein